MSKGKSIDTSRKQILISVLLEILFLASKSELFFFSSAFVVSERKGALCCLHSDYLHIVSSLFLEPHTL